MTNIAVIGAGYVGMSLAVLLSQSNNVDVLDIDFHLPAFLTLRGPFAWLGWAWVGCSGSRGPGEPIKNVVPPVLPGSKWDKSVLNTDYGTPLGICSETAPGSQVFQREYSKATVKVDCAHLTGTIAMK